MNKSDDQSDLHISKSVAKNTLFNFLGYGVPLLVALFLIPPLINGLGDERFGILNLVWIVIGYFSFFDFGIGRGLTKIISEKIGLNQTEDIPDIFWTSFILMFVASLIFAFILSFFMIPIVELFKISPSLKPEVLTSFYALAFAIPIVSTTAGLRGVLEAHQKFKNINLIRIFLGVFTFLGPLLVLFVINSLFWIVIVMIVIRVFVWILYLLQCFKINTDIKKKLGFKFESFKPVLKFSVWITVANIVGPIIAYSDRFLIGALVSATAITYYATPHQVITKLLLIPGSFINVLFPLFSSNSLKNPELTRKLFIKAAKLVFVIIFPAVFITVAFASEGLELWLGKKFAENSSLVLQLLAVGILMNSISIVPNYFFQGIGRPKIPTLINLVELPLYILAMFVFIKNYGIVGAAFTYLVAASFDALLMYIMVYKFGMLKFWSNNILLLVVISILSLIIPFLIPDLYIKIILACVIITTFITVTWYFILSNEEKTFLISKFKLTFNGG